MKVFQTFTAAALIIASLAVSALGSLVASVPGKMEPTRLRWQGRVIKVAISSSVTRQNSNIKIDSDLTGAIRRSLQAWQNVSDIEFQIEQSDRQSVSPAGINGDGVSLITIAQTPENVLLFSRNPLAESAKTRIFYNRKGFITEADIVLNPFQQFSTDGTFGTFDLEATLTHEVGHLLGLKHSAVLGAVMSDTQSRNGSLGFAELAPRTLSESDITAIRELYGTGTDDDSCCAAINGKLNIAGGRGGKILRVWAEDSETGRVIAQTNTSADGAFRLGGLPAANYLLYWQKKDDIAGTSIGQLDPFRLEKGDAKSVNEKITQRRSDIGLSYIGLNSQLTDSGVNLSAGREYVVYLGGKNLDPDRLKLNFNSPYLSIEDASVASQDFGDKVSVVSFVVKIAADTPGGSYSIFATGDDGSRASLIGALNIGRGSDNQ